MRYAAIACVILFCLSMKARAAKDVPEPVAGLFSVTVGGVEKVVQVVRVAPESDAERSLAMDDAVHPDAHFAEAAYATFDIDRAQTVFVHCRQKVESVKILPTSAGVHFAVKENDITFEARPGQLLTIEVNGNWLNSLHLFANTPDKDVPTITDAKTLYFGPGVHAIVDPIRLTSGQTLYLAEGAILQASGSTGAVVEVNGDHIAIRGRGVIDGTNTPRHTRNLITLTGQDITLEGIILSNASTWNVPIRRSTRVTVRNLKIFGCRANSDGIDICNSSDVTVDHCFLRTLDDLVVIKADKGQGPVHGIVVQDCVLWNQVAHALSIGAELREPVDDVVFRNCDVIHDTGREWTLRIYHCDAAEIRNVRFENIRVEESKRFISLWIGKQVWTKDPARGHIDGVTFQNITAATGDARVALQGFDDQHAIHDVRFDNVQIGGHALRMEDVRPNRFASGVSVRP